ncbi:MAG: nucleotide sugar dehydrogenase [Candidatus Paceibacterota bacterium]|jgi:UDPglucose 6-dehydrogenase
MSKQICLSVIGLGKLGICAAVCPAYKGYKVLGLDINKRTVDLVNKGKAPVIEPQLQTLIDKSRNNLRATQDFEKIIKESDVTFLIVPTPSKPDGHFSDKFLKDAFVPLAKHLKDKKNYHLFVITSTVSPGTTESNLIPLIEKYSGKKLNKDFGICYNPEFIALGSIIKNSLNPDMVLIGESDKKAGNILEKIYKTVCDNNPYIARMSIVSAEITKISLNAYVTMKISFANTLGNLCDRIPGSEVDKISRALGADKRVSPYYLKAGLAFGGPCFPRDGRAFVAFAKKYAYDAKLVKATDAVNRLQIELTIKKIQEVFKNSKNNTVSILGLAYKTDTPVIEESAAIFLIKELLKKKAKISVYDPLAIESTRKVFGKKIDYAKSVKSCINSSSVIIITTPEKEFLKINKNYFTKLTTVIDCWRILQYKPLGKNVIYDALGKYEKNRRS